MKLEILSDLDIISDNNGCLDILNSCKNYNPKSAACSHRWNGGNYAGLTVSDTCKKSCGKCGGMLDHFILNMFLIDMYLPKFSL